MLVSEAVEEYIRHIKVEQGYSPTTVINYQNRLRYLVKWMVANGYPTPALADLTTPVLRRFLQYLVEDGQRPRTVKGKFACIDGMCRFLQQEELLDANPTDRITLPKLDAATRLLITDEQVRLLFEATERVKVERRQVMARAILAVLAFGGLRRAECRDLLPEDINCTEKWVLVRSGKGSKSRRVFLPDVAVSHLREWLAIRGKCSHEYLFGSLTRRFHDTGIASLIEELKRLSGQAGNDAIKPHSIRHAYATRLLRNGANLVDISAALGHRGTNALRTTQIYLSTSEEQLRGIASLAELPSAPPPRPPVQPEATTAPAVVSESASHRDLRVRRGIRR